ncbi:nuclear protein MDM1 isoform X2 [Parambassis ranga]|nr:nuclear protein MDM1 isoform X2 [Parambassis ranga]
MGISREPALQRRRRLGPAQSCSSLFRLPVDHYPVAELHRKAPPAASRSRLAHKRELPADPKPVDQVNPGHPIEPETPLAPRPAADPEPSTKQTELEQPVTSAKPTSQSQLSQPVTSASDGQQQQPPSMVEHALRQRAGLSSGGQRSACQRSSEYHRQFSWKKPVTAASPLLTAEQALYSSSRSVPPFKKNPVPMETEYRQRFLGQVPPTGPRLRRHLELQRVPLFHTHMTNRRWREESLNKPRPQQEAPQRDEIAQSPLMATPPPRVQGGHRIAEGGGATDSSTHQVKERRQKAMSYRHRAWGANFSRHHLGQLLSEHNALWEPTDSTDCATDPAARLTSLSPEPGSRSPSYMEALDLNSNSSRRSSAVSSTRHTNKKTQTDPHTNPGPPAERRSVWEEEQGAEEEEEENTDEEEGRLPTPRLKIRPVQRTHHDLTTPAAGGAILVGKAQGSDEPSPHKQQRCGSAVSTAVGVRTAVHTPVKPKEAWSERNPASPDHKAAASPSSKPIRVKQTPPSPAAPPAPPPHCIQGTLRHPDFQHNGELGLRFREMLCPGGGCGSDEDGRLSVMSWRSAASCSMASAVLERAQKRRDNFWGKR